MADQNPTPENANVVYGSRTEEFINENRKRFVYVIGAVIALIVLSIGYDEFIVKPAEAEANADMWRAEQYFMSDSTDWAMNGDGLAPSLQDIMDEHAGTSAAARAAYETGLILRSQGDFTAALDAFNSAEMDSELFSVIVDLNRGDCMVELGDHSGALSVFSAAARSASGTTGADYLAPMALWKAATVAIELGDIDAAASSLNSILEDYPTSPQNGAATGLAASLGNS
ncbi:MAG: tetratricopeptide repeat protein [Flavobacteriales bacterium]|nr:tetratricopeptide repeat protein [Flavobacteriales bacterium]